MATPPLEEIAFPVQLTEANFVSGGFSVLVFHVEWFNVSSDLNIASVELLITAHDSNGDIILTIDGAQSITYRMFEENAVSPGERNSAFRHTIHGQYPQVNYREDDYGWNSPGTFNISVLSARDDSGRIWNNDNHEGAINAVLLGRKGFLLTETAENTFINGYVSDFEKGLLSAGIDVAIDPQFHSRSEEYYVLRYPDFDIRIDLSENESAASDLISIVYYYKYSEREEDVEILFDTWTSLVRTAVDVGIPSLTDTELDEIVDDVVENAGDEWMFDNIDYYGRFDYFGFCDRFGEEEEAIITTISKEQFDASSFWTWAYGSPYETQQSVEPGDDSDISKIILGSWVNDYDKSIPGSDYSSEYITTFLEDGLIVVQGWRNRDTGTYVIEGDKVVAEFTDCSYDFPGEGYKQYDQQYTCVYTYNNETQQLDRKFSQEISSNDIGGPLTKLTTGS